MAFPNEAIATALLSYRKRLLAGSDDFWPGLRDRTKRGANKFLLACIIDLQQKAKRAWKQSWRFVEEEMGDPPDIWREIVKRHPSEEDWLNAKSEYGLHRYGWAHRRIYRIGKALIELYDGDARRIWESQSRGEIAYRLTDLQVGPQLTQMILGALHDTGHIENAADPKADVHVCRVLGRILRGTPLAPGEVKPLARLLNPSAPWLLDRPLYVLGSGEGSDDAAGACSASTPACHRCVGDIRNDCLYFATSQ